MPGEYAAPRAAPAARLIGLVGLIGLIGSNAMKINLNM